VVDGNARCWVRVGPDGAALSKRFCGSGFVDSGITAGKWNIKIVKKHTITSSFSITTTSFPISLNLTAA
jgi:hypothetical protein